MEPIRFRGDHILVLDQRKLPLESVWISVESAEEMARLIQEMALRGAPLIGIAAAYALALEGGKHGLTRLEEMGEKLRSARPTAVNLSWAVSRMLKHARESPATLAEEALRIHEEDRRACARIGELGAALLTPGPLLTHCNTGSLATGGEGTAYAILKEGFRRGKVPHVYVCESRPYLQGARLTAYELREDGIPFALITDSTAGYLMASGKVASVAVGADRVAANGDVANKIGTYALAVLARENGIPFLVAAPTSSLDPLLPTGQSIPIEERNPDEVLQFMGIPIAPAGTRALHPAFDVTPSRYVKAIITENGVLSPPYDLRRSLAAI